MIPAAAPAPPTAVVDTADRGLDRVLDLGPRSVRRRTFRRRLLSALSFAPVVAIIVVGLRAPSWFLQPFEHWPTAPFLVPAGFMGLAVVGMLLSAFPMVRAGINPFDNRDPARLLSRGDRAWARARVAAGAPVGRDQHEVVSTAADWMARQVGAVPSHLSRVALGAGLGLANLGALNILLGLVLVAQGVVLPVLVVGRARIARRWLALYAPERLGEG